MGKLWEKMKKGKVFTSFRSLKTRMFCIIMAAGIVPCIVLHFGILERYLDNTIETRTNEVQTQVKIIADHLITAVRWSMQSFHSCLISMMAEY